MKDYPVGTRLQYDNVELVVEAQKNNEPVCNGCYFSEAVRVKIGISGYANCSAHRMACTKYLREDNRHVIFRILN